MTFAIRNRYLILAAGAAAGAGWMITYLRHVYQQDYLLSVFGGYAFFGWLPTYHHSGLHLYATNPEIQVGPLALALIGLVDKSAPGFETGRMIMAALSFLCALISARAIERTALNLGIPERRAAISTLLGGPLLIGSFAIITWFAHVEDALALTMTLLAVAAISGNRPWWVPAILLGAAVLCKPWAIVMFPLLLMTDRRSLLVAGSVAFLPWLPFITAAPGTLHALGSYVSTVMPHSALRAFGVPVDTVASGGLRTGGMLLGVLAAALAVRRGKWLAAPLAAYAGRMLVEPRWYAYYGAAALAGALLVDFTQKRLLPVWAAWTVIAEFAVQQWAPSVIGAVFHLAFAVSVLVVIGLGGGPREVVELARRARSAQAVVGGGQIVADGVAADRRPVALDSD